MRTKKYLIWIVLLSAFFMFIFLSSCAGTRDTSQGYDESIFGDESLEDIDDQLLSDFDASSDEAEVLRLLGITEEDNVQTLPQSEFSESSTTPTSDADISAQVNNLEDEATKKETELSNLKAELAERDSRIQDLQTQLTKPQTSLGTGAAPGSFQGKYEDALTTYRNRNYKLAIQKFDDLLALNVNNSLVDNCQYWKGECHYALGDYNQAILEFQKVFVYSNSNKLDSAQLKLGLCYLRLDNRERAKSEFEKLISSYPDSEYISRARTYLSRL